MLLKNCLPMILAFSKNRSKWTGGRSVWADCMHTGLESMVCVWLFPKKSGMLADFPYLHCILQSAGLYSKSTPIAKVGSSCLLCLFGAGCWVVGFFVHVPVCPHPPGTAVLPVLARSQQWMLSCSITSPSACRHSAYAVCWSGCVSGVLAESWFGDMALIHPVIGGFRSDSVHSCQLPVLHSCSVKESVSRKIRKGSRRLSW